LVFSDLIVDTVAVEFAPFTVSNGGWSARLAEFSADARVRGPAAGLDLFADRHEGRRGARLDPCLCCSFLDTSAHEWCASTIIDGSRRTCGSTASGWRRVATRCPWWWTGRRRGSGACMHRKPIGELIIAAVALTHDAVLICYFVGIAYAATSLRTRWIISP